MLRFYELKYNTSFFFHEKLPYEVCSYAERNTLIKRGAQLVPIVMPIVEKKTCSKKE